MDVSSFTSLFGVGAPLARLALTQKLPLRGYPWCGVLSPRGAPRELARAAGIACHGMPIIIQQNDHRLSLYNGDTGIILKDKRHHYWAVFQRNDRFIRFPVETLAPYELAFAITVHKSQGSEYQSTLLILPDTDNRLLSREILYTAVTRAKTELLIYGSIETLQIGIDKKLHRESGIELWSNA